MSDLKVRPGDWPFRSIEQLGTVAEPVAQRFNLDRKIGASFSPVQRTHNLHGNFTELTGGEAGDSDHGNSIVVEDLLGRRR
jgi:hypothetical protein